MFWTRKSANRAIVKLSAMARMEPRQFYGHIHRRIRNSFVPFVAPRYRQSLRKAANALPAFAPVEAAFPMAELVTTFCEAEYSGTLPDAFDGLFHLMNKTIDFGSIEAIDWRVSADEGDRQIWRSNLSQMSYLPVALRQYPADAIPFAAHVIRSFEAVARFDSSRDFKEAWHPYIASRRVLALSAMLLLAPRAARGSEDWRVIENFLRLNVAFIMRNLEVDIGVNHLERNLSALALFSLCCARIPDEIARILRDNFDAIVRRTICDDGVPKERSAMYHALTIKSCRIFSALPIWSHEQRALLERRLSSMETALAALTLGDGQPVLFNDSWLGENPPTAKIVGVRDIGFHVMPEGGYVRLKSQGWIVVMDTGPIGPSENPGHGHADFLAVEASIGRHRFFVDPGTLIYTAGEARNHLRSWEAHNGPAFVGAHPVTFTDSFKVGKNAAAVLDHAGQEPSGAQRCEGSLQFSSYKVSRSTVLDGAALTVNDRWSGSGKRQSRFLVPGEWEVEREGKAIQFRRGPHCATLTWSHDASLELGAAHWSRYYRIEEPAHELVFSPAAQSEGFQLKVVLA
ncbi:MAG: heparinase II/III-family protein [Hyphomicrobiales bacterium]|nr:heparinase II/III-family protein [Hyphomicrobiales bacterium]